MRTIHLVSVGKMKTPHWLAACKIYRARLTRAWQCQETIIRDADASLPPIARAEEEGARLIQAVRQGEWVVCLDERGSQLSSLQFAGKLAQIWEDGRTPCFIIGGAFGLSEGARKKAEMLLSLGAMTLPHELARVVLWEQLYRAQCILARIPYHHE